jgi:hypothetical protein
MSYRIHWPEVRSSVVAGDVISGCRDNETKTYRLFVNKGWRDVHHGSATGHQIDSCECCDLSVEDLRKLQSVVDRVLLEHEPWSEVYSEDTEV